VGGRVAQDFHLCEPEADLVVEGHGQHHTNIGHM